MKYPSFSSRPQSPLHPSISHHHTFSEIMMDENLDYAEYIITHWNFDSNTKFSSVFSGDRKEARRYLESVNSLQTAMHYYLNQNSGRQKLIRAQKLMQIAMKRLEKEFYVILSANRKNLDSESVSSRSSSSLVSDIFEDYTSEETEEIIATATPPRTPPHTPNRDSDIAMADLRSIAECMIASGYVKECVNIYKIIRKSIIDETLYYLGIEKSLKHSQMVKMEWRVLEQKIKSWVHAVKVAIKTLFQGERILCDAVFSSNENIAESCFTEISKESAIGLFTFPQNLTKSKKILSPDKIFRVLDMHDAIVDLWPLIESTFSHDSISIVKSEAISAVVKLAESVRIMLSQFESAIQKDTSKAPIGGGVHPLTRYVMNFLVFTGDYSGSISDILSDSPIRAHTPLPESYFLSPISATGEDLSAAATLTNRLAWLILVLLCKLDGKAVLYNDVALSYLFLANNLNYVVSKIRNSSLGLLMGPDWIWKHGSKVKQYVAKYERMGWGDVASSLPEDPTAEISPEEVTECFRRFNSGFSEAYKKQSSWVIPDPKLRDEVKVSIARKIFPGYRVFYMNHRGDYAREVGVAPIVRYAPEDLDNYLSDLFFPAAGVSGSSTTSSYGNSSSLVVSRGR